MFLAAPRVAQKTSRSQESSFKTQAKSPRQPGPRRNSFSPPSGNPRRRNTRRRQQMRKLLVKLKNKL